MKNIKDYIGTDTAIHCVSEKEGDYISKMVDKYRGTYSALQCLENINFSELINIGEFVIYLDNRCFDTLNDCILNNPDTQLVRASEFLPQVKGELTKEEAKVLTEEYEFGERIGSLAWAYKVAEKEGEVWHCGEVWHYGEKAVLSNFNRLVWTCINGSEVPINDLTLINWTRKPIDPKEELIEELFQIWSKASGHLRQDFEQLLENYNITKKTNQAPEHDSATKIEE